MRRTGRSKGLMAALALVATACSSGVVSADPQPGGTAPRPDVVLAGGALVQFDACEAFLDYVISHAVDLVGPYGIDGGAMIWGSGEAFVDSATTTAAAERPARDADGGDSSNFSETNVQVEGVDEPDIVKTDGKRIVVMAEGDLILVDVTGDEPVEDGRLSVGGLSVQSLFLEGDRVLLFGSAWGGGPWPVAELDAVIAPGGTPTLHIIEVDIGDDPEIVRTMTIDGSLISGRMVDDTVRLVLTSGPVGFEWDYPSGSGLRAEREATEKNREIVRDSTEENWIPYYVVADADGDVVDEGTLFDCDRAAHPEEFSGLDMLSVVTIDLGVGLDVIDATGVLAAGDTVYASEDSLYVATQNWQTWRWQATGQERDRPDGPTTEIHKFDIANQRLTEYLGSGEVDGYLLNQFAMDEHEGMLRVASTITPNWWGSGPDSESRVTVLR
ncbi:MAG TPA: beta-propeller domain-containing protein, partial [Acidimicrobiia bacterium]|nr:beta-propeller domain-containing protein [Acidimicrobiia bacterium]